MIKALKEFARSASRRAQMVDLELLIRFVFPSELQHAMSTGRLLAFGFYGPLDGDAQLRSGHKGSHVVGRWELDTMCRTFEREDILQVYMPAGKSPSSLSEQEAEELLAQADTRLKVAKGKAMMRQVTPDVVRGLFADLKRDPIDGLLNFHDMQQRIIEYRSECIQRNKVIFPDLKDSRGPSKTNKKHAGEGGGDALSATTLARTDRGRGANNKTSYKVSQDVAPPTMFQRDAGLVPMDIAQRTNKLLATRAYQICNVESGNSSELTANVRLLREPMTLSAMRGETAAHPASWDGYCARRGTNAGGFVKGAASSTTAKRRSTIADHN